MRPGQIRGKTLVAILGVHLKGNADPAIQVTLIGAEDVTNAARVTLAQNLAREMPLEKPKRQKKSETPMRVAITGGRIEPIRALMTDTLEISAMMDIVGIIKITIEVIMIEAEAIMIRVTGKIIDTINGIQIGTGRNKGTWTTMTVRTFMEQESMLGRAAGINVASRRQNQCILWSLYLNPIILCPYQACLPPH